MTAVTEKVKSKIKKLLALAQSDNPNEAKIAKVQAEKLMRKHSLSESELEIVDIPVKVSNRMTLRDYELIIVSEIASISGCIPYQRTRKIGRKFETRICFFGVSYKAEIAAYSLNVLLAQLDADIKNAGLKRARQSEIDSFCVGWICSVIVKVQKIFPKDEPSESVKQAFNKKTESEQMPEAKTKATETKNDYAREGFKFGEKARLNIAASDKSEKPKLIGASCNEPR